MPKPVEHNTLLVDGKGQGNEGGHDAWAGMDPAQLDRIRITSASFTKTGFDITGEAAAAYAPSLGLTRFTRHIVLAKPGTLTVTDSVESSIPHRFAEVLHTDTTFTRVPNTPYFQTSVGGQTLKVLPTDSFANTIEPNIVMGPGRPGSVDKGTPEPRGQRLVLDTESPATQFAFQWTLTF